MATETRSFKCIKCKLDVVVDVPAFEVLNGQRASHITFVHDRPDVCPHCGQAYLFALNKQKVNALFGWVAVEIKAEQSSNIILPPGAEIPS